MSSEVADSDVVVSGMMVENTDECMKMLVGRTEDVSEVIADVVVLIIIVCVDDNDVAEALSVEVEMTEVV